MTSVDVDDLLQGIDMSSSDPSFITDKQKEEVEKLLSTIGTGSFDLDLGLNNDNDFNNFLKDVEKTRDSLSVDTEELRPRSSSNSSKPNIRSSGGGRSSIESDNEIIVNIKSNPFPEEPFQYEDEFNKMSDNEDAIDLGFAEKQSPPLTRNISPTGSSTPLSTQKKRESIQQEETPRTRLSRVPSQEQAHKEAEAALEQRIHQRIEEEKRRRDDERRKKEARERNEDQERQIEQMEQRKREEEKRRMEEAIRKRAEEERNRQEELRRQDIRRKEDEKRRQSIERRESLGGVSDEDRPRYSEKAVEKFRYQVVKQGLEDSSVLQRHLQTIEEKYQVELKSIEELQVVYSDYERTLENQLASALSQTNNPAFSGSIMDKLQFIESEARRYETASLTYEQPIKKMKAMMDELKVASETLKRQETANRDKVLKTQAEVRKYEESYNKLKEHVDSKTANAQSQVTAQKAKVDQLISSKTKTYTESEKKVKELSDQLAAKQQENSELLSIIGELMAQMESNAPK